MTASSQLSHPLRSQRLNQITHEPHSHLDNLVKSHDPFGSPERFSHFVAAQYLFQRDLEKLYNDPQLIRLVPDLPQRCRVEQAVLLHLALDLDQRVAQPAQQQVPGGIGLVDLCGGAPPVGMDLRHALSVSGDDLRARGRVLGGFERRGLDFGPDFRSIRQLWRGTSQASAATGQPASMSSRCRSDR